jgi:hypothetical protein
MNKSGENREIKRNRERRMLHSQSPAWIRDRRPNRGRRRHQRRALLPFLGTEFGGQNRRADAFGDGDLGTNSRWSWSLLLACAHEDLHRWLGFCRDSTRDGRPSPEPPNSGRIEPSFASKSDKAHWEQTGGAGRQLQQEGRTRGKVPPCRGRYKQPTCSGRPRSTTFSVSFTYGKI